MNAMICFLCNLVKKLFTKMLPKIPDRLPVATKICLNLNANDYSARKPSSRVGFLFFFFNISMNS